MAKACHGQGATTLPGVDNVPWRVEATPAYRTLKIMCLVICIPALASELFVAGFDIWRSATLPGVGRRAFQVGIPAGCIVVSAALCVAALRLLGRAPGRSLALALSAVI